MKGARILRERLEQIAAARTLDAERESGPCEPSDVSAGGQQREDAERLGPPSPRPQPA